ncbi:MAG: HAD-IIB family hydrolase [Lachnospiraceae bacterium]|nr:HAD-IIB family hydrolase [Lachnospiraceae bacterium]MBR4061123.1 HAD-IIB family hydrolase [Lachnospiraceae bacterium]
MTIKTIIVDLDRTLLHTDKTISSYTAKILKECKKNAIRTMVATARPLRAIKQYCELVDFDAMVVSNGARVICGNQRKEYGICQESADRLLKALKQYPELKITLETGDCAYSNKFIDDYETVICDDLIAVANAEGVLKILVHIYKEEDLAIIKKELTEDLYYTIANGYLMQIMNKSATKWNGIKAMLDIHDCSCNEAAYFGDDYDDIEPMKMCGLGIAVSNAIEEVKAVADYITEDNDADGVAKFIEQRLLSFDNIRIYGDKSELKSIWMEEEKAAHIHGWDFSHINGRYEESAELPWNYKQIIKQYLNDDMNILDYDTGGGEFLLSLIHPFDKTSATEGYPPNVKLCKEILLPLGIDFKECNNPKDIPFESESFDMIINRHGDFNAKELYRLLKKGGIFITQQVGEDNDRDLVEIVLPNTEKPFPHMNLKEQKRVFDHAGFQIIKEGEAYCPIIFYDVGAFVWFAHIVEWEFPNFSVDKCFENLLEMQKMIEDKGRVVGTTHRYLIVAKKI